MNPSDISVMLSQILKEITTLKERSSYEEIPLHIEMPIRSPEQNELFASLAKSQAEMSIAIKSSTNPFFKSSYASFADVIKASRACLTKHNLSVSQDIIERENGQKYLYTVLGHASGQFKASRVKILPPKSDIQEFGKYVSYLKRYAYASLVGVADALEDDDGETAMVEVRKDIYPYKKEQNPPDKVETNPHQQVTISRDQYKMLNDELLDHPEEGIVQQILNHYKIQTLADLPREEFEKTLSAIKRKRRALEK